jgi:hypothetical protein
MLQPTKQHAQPIMPDTVRPTLYARLIMPRNNPTPVLKNTGQNARYLRGIFENHPKMMMKV